MGARNLTAVSVVIPVLNDADALSGLLRALQHADLQVIVADGGSSDASAQVAAAAGAELVRAPRGRGPQLAAGAAAAQGRFLWLLHADSRLTAPASEYLRVIGSGDPAASWGRFDVAFDDASPSLRMVATLMNWRSRATAVCTGDQGIYVARALLQRVGGVPQQSLMEDIELSKRLKISGGPRVEGPQLITSARRWRAGGVWRTIVFMWWFRLRYWAGADPERLAREYYL